MADDKDPGLAAVADAAVADEPNQEGGNPQGVFENTDYTKITFLGTNYQSLTLNPQIGDEFEFIVRGRIKETGDRALSNGFTEHFGKVDVSAILLRGTDD